MAETKRSEADTMRGGANTICGVADTMSGHSINFGIVESSLCLGGTSNHYETEMIKTTLDYLFKVDICGLGFFLPSDFLSVNHKHNF